MTVSVCVKYNKRFSANLADYFHKNSLTQTLIPALITSYCKL